MAPLAPLLARADVTDVWINRPCEAWVESVGGGIARVELPGLDEGALWGLARQFAAAGHQGVSRAQPLLAATLPGGVRVQVVAPPATRGSVVIAIRKQAAPGRGLGDYLADGGFGDVGVGAGQGARAPIILPDAGDGAEVTAFLRGAVAARRNIVVSGGTGTGKTTFLNALLREIPLSERLLLIEDTPELELVHPNAVGLVAVRGGQGEADVGMADLLGAALRLRPDRIILGELRGAEAFSFLRSIGTGHPGSLTTLHADSPQGAVEQLVLMALGAGSGLSRGDILDYITATVDIIVQLERVDGRRRVAQLWALR